MDNPSLANLVHLRSVTPDDGDLLLRIYASTRDEQLRQMGWAENQIDAFVRMQFEAQTKHYRTHFAGDEYIVVVGDQEIGRIILKRYDDEILIVDMAVLTPHRNKGVGTQLMQQVLAESDRSNKPVRLHVLKFSPAVRFYERFEFSTISDDGLNLEMIRHSRDDQTCHA